MDPITIAAMASAAAGLMNASKPAAAAAMPTYKSDIFGASMFAADSSGWLVNFGDAAKQSQSNAGKSGPTLSSQPVQPGIDTPIAGIPTIYILAGGVLLLIFLLKKRG